MESPQAIVVARARDNTIVAVNDEWLSLTGFSRSQAVGRTIVEMGHWPDKDSLAQALQPLLVGRRVRDLDVSMVVAHGVHRLICMGAVLADVQGESYVLFYMRDVTVERMSQDAVRAAPHAEDGYRGRCFRRRSELMR